MDTQYEIWKIPDHESVRKIEIGAFNTTTLRFAGELFEIKIPVLSLGITEIFVQDSKIGTIETSVIGNARKLLVGNNLNAENVAILLATSILISKN